MTGVLTPSQLQSQSQRSQKENFLQPLRLLKNILFKMALRSFCLPLLGVGDRQPKKFYNVVFTNENVKGFLSQMTIIKFFLYHCHSYLHSLLSSQVYVAKSTLLHRPFANRPVDQLHHSRPALGCPQTEGLEVGNRLGTKRDVGSRNPTGSWPPQKQKNLENPTFSTSRNAKETSSKPTCPTCKTNTSRKQLKHLDSKPQKQKHPQGMVQKVLRNKPYKGPNSQFFPLETYVDLHVLLSSSKQV